MLCDFHRVQPLSILARWCPRPCLALRCRLQPGVSPGDSGLLQEVVWSSRSGAQLQGLVLLETLDRGGFATVWKGGGSRPCLVCDQIGCSGLHGWVACPARACPLPLRLPRLGPPLLAARWNGVLCAAKIIPLSDCDVESVSREAALSMSVSHPNVRVGAVGVGKGCWSVGACQQRPGVAALAVAGGQRCLRLSGPHARRLDAPSLTSSLQVVATYKVATVSMAELAGLHPQAPPHLLGCLAAGAVAHGEAEAELGATVILQVRAVRGTLHSRHVSPAPASPIPCWCLACPCYMQELCSRSVEHCLQDGRVLYWEDGRPDQARQPLPWRASQRWAGHISLRGAKRRGGLHLAAPSTPCRAL